ncbi:MAG: 50S ribosomal protein L2, partial [Rhodospirillales bacterium]|nr:50S ribosomal protein L2 [Rhodospirillales bacterium]
MALKSYKPTTPGQRNLVLVDRSGLWKGKPVKELTEGLTKNGGRNNTGRITARRRGGGHKRRYRMVDFKRRKMDVSATVERLEYDPNRTAFIALIKYEDGELSYIIAPQRLAPGDVVVSSAKADIKPGNAMPMSAIPVGTIIHNVEMKQGKGGQMARSAGTYAQLVGKDQGYAQLRLNSGEVRMVRAECMATIGAVSNSDQQN